MNLMVLFLLSAGLFAICGSAFDWDFFFNSRKAQFFVSAFGRNGARVFYALLGVAIVVLSTLLMTGALEQAN